MKEKLSIMQMIAEEKRIREQVLHTVDGAGCYLKFITYYYKNRPFVGARTAEEQEKFQREGMQTIESLLKRRSAIKKALTKANRETTVIVPEEPDLFDLIQNKEPQVEEITIAEAINRKNSYKTKKGMFNNETPISMEKIAQAFLYQYTADFNARSDYDEKARIEVRDQLSKRFPADSRNNWSIEKYAETKKQLEAENEVIRIDPFNLMENNAIKKYYDAIQKYILEIDTIIAQANASTIVEIEY